MQLAGRRTLLIVGLLAGAIAIYLGARSAGVLGRGDEHVSAAGEQSGARTAARSRPRDLGIQVQQQRPRTSASGEPIEVLEARLARVQGTLDHYRQATKYPPTSRPLSEQPDQVRPHSVPNQRLPLVGQDGKPSDKALVILRQDHYYLAGSETVSFTVECGTPEEGAVPCDILESTAISPGGAQRAEVPFAAEDMAGVHVGTFQPSTQGFADYYGPIRVELAIRLAGETGTAAFDLEYTPRPPAVFTRRVNERLEKGSLVLGVELEIEKPGRYVIAARVDDATGRSFAYVSFNEELPKGRAEAALVVFGKLILDEKARAPFRLRDVEGFLLKEDTYPDRELVPTLEGVVHTTKAYRDQDFSDEEWQSDERQRHLDEFERDVERAKDELEDAKRPVPPPAPPAP